MTLQTASKKYNVDGVLRDRPFKISRLGHVGLTARVAQPLADFYVDVLGFRVSELQDVAESLPPELAQELRQGGDCSVYLLRHNTDHHTFFVTSENVVRFLCRHVFHDDYDGATTVNQISWQVGSLRQVVDGAEYLKARRQKVLAVGRDMPGSNWHVYMRDAQLNINELFYGMEQVGWQGTSKPLAMYDRAFQEAPALPQICEEQEVDNAMAQGVDLQSGARVVERLPASYDVAGVLLARPFKIVRVGPIGIYSEDVGALRRSYTNIFGLRETTSTCFHGENLAFLRANNEHHCLALAPCAVREHLGHAADTRLAWIGFEVASYGQLRAAIAHLAAAGHEIIDLAPELRPGIAYAAALRDPGGHLVMLHWGMTPVGPGGAGSCLSPGDAWRVADWPEVLEEHDAPDSVEPFLGPYL